LNFRPVVYKQHSRWRKVVETHLKVVEKGAEVVEKYLKVVEKRTEVVENLALVVEIIYLSSMLATFRQKQPSFWAENGWSHNHRRLYMASAMRPVSQRRSSSR